MDALNKAEKAKRQGQASAADANAGGSSATPAPALELTPLTPSAAEPTISATTKPTGSPPTLPELPSDMEILDQEFIAHAAAAKPAAKGKKPPHPSLADPDKQASNARG